MKLTTLVLPGGQVLVWAPEGHEWWEYATGRWVNPGRFSPPAELRAAAERGLTVLTDDESLVVADRVSAVLGQGLKHQFCPICVTGDRRACKHRS